MKKQEYIPWEELEELKRKREEKAGYNILDLATWLRVIGWIAIIVGVVIFLDGREFIAAYTFGSGVTLVFVARVLNGIGVMVEKSVENTRNSTQMLALMKQMKRMMEQHQPDNRQPECREQQAGENEK